LPAQTTWSRNLRPEEVVTALDKATLLVLPSRSEGMGRVVVEALLRGRPVVASRIGGIPDLVEDGVNGLLLEPEDHDGFAAALTRLLAGRPEAERLAAGARAAGERLVASPAEYACAVRKLVEGVARS
jgi:glycosyltransferase involved in cell wall biosynthesis